MKLDNSINYLLDLGTVSGYFFLLNDDDVKRRVEGRVSWLPVGGGRPAE